MAHLWLVDAVILAMFLPFLVYLFVKMLRAPKTEHSWQRWTCITTGFAASVLLLLDHVNALRHHIYSSTSDLRFFGIVLALASALLIRKAVVVRRHA